MMKDETIERYLKIRRQTEMLCRRLETEDYVIQAMDDVSPPKWHLAHTTWFFETFILLAHDHAAKAFDPTFAKLFNSYYQSLGEPYPRAARGLLSRPTVENIYAYRQAIDAQIQAYLLKISTKKWTKIYPILEIGLQHEQQHQELLLTDIKYNYSLHAFDFPAYLKGKEGYQPTQKSINVPAMHFTVIDEGPVFIGFSGEGFCYDNEQPLHKVWLAPYRIANRLVTNGEYLAFIEDDGYKNSAYWLSDGWECMNTNQWHAPLYWYAIDGEWYQFTLHGLIKLPLHQPVCHISYYEADAYARWQGKRLPTEAEWEYMTHSTGALLKEGHFLEDQLFYPATATHQPHIPQQFLGDVWEWTMSAYSPYPGYKPYVGSLGEYNAKFMCNQMVLRGGSCATPRSHIRVSYRNFFQADKRWQFSGLRLAEDI